jgi:two-component system sensor histidine kinase DesK
MYWVEYLSLLLHFLLGVAVLVAPAVMIDPSMMFYGICIVLLFGYIERALHLIIGVSGLVIAYMIVSLVTAGNPLAFTRHYQFFFLLLQAGFPIAIFLHQKSKKLHHQLNQANEQIVTLVKEKERNRFARELHDTLGHTLTMIILKSELASRLIVNDTARAQAEIDEIEKISRMALRQTREIVSSNRHYSLPKELKEVTHFLEAKGISVKISLLTIWPQLKATDETMLALAIREAVTNVARHSAAKHCLINSKIDHHQLIFEVKDDGIGLGEVPSAGSGMHTMRERMKLVGGTVNILSNANGTTLLFSMPLT